ncbi:MAG: hypothetical protein E7540_03805 [Ruminococcaceae bacterium]|nr:hypothetical protein [Oscillospiraceae bacterium]
MKKLSLLIALCMLLTIGGVYATWTYTQNTDVADEAVNMNMNLTDVAYSGSYGTYKVDVTGLSLAIDPKAGTTHTTALYATGNIIVTFTPNSVAPADVKENGVKTTYAFSLANPNWKYEDKDIVTINHTEKHDVVWQDNGDGTFSFTISADEFMEHVALTEFELDTKVKYDDYNAVLGTGSIVITVSDGVSASN